ncbi:uncharacterized protein LOC124910593 [Impatiens glandulifera]|uniref:uncharacterized protein LOC124910593 n=1 Tax=Impatiens glandulifera TaxID=253017 RepID=UPI001FB1817A|nr:uncharacterized protein LOC124910593 [Impatiens glandulifera]
MLKPFICGTGSFDNHLEQHEPCSSRPTNSTPKKTKKIGSCKPKENTNPYSNRGLDKFSALLAELEDKRQKIYSQINPDEISFLRFVYSNSNDCRPIVIKVKQRKQDSNPINNDNPVVPVVEEFKDKKLTPSSSPPPPPPVMNIDRKEKKQSSSCTMKKLGMRRPMNYLSAALILILVMLVLFGKSFAIVCLSMGWYLVPAIKGESFEIGKSKATTKKKKDFTRRDSKMLKMKKIDDGSSSPNSVLVGAMADYAATPRRQGPRKCW